MESDTGCCRVMIDSERLSIITDQECEVQSCIDSNCSRVTLYRRDCLLYTQHQSAGFELGGGRVYGGVENLDDGGPQISSATSVAIDDCDLVSFHHQRCSRNICIREDILSSYRDQVLVPAIGHRLEKQKLGLRQPALGTAADL